MDDYVKKFFDDIVNSDNFDGDYFKAMIDALALSRVYVFIKSMKGDNKND